MSTETPLCPRCKTNDCVRNDSYGEPYCRVCGEYVRIAPPGVIECVVILAAIIVFSPVIVLFAFVLGAMAAIASLFTSILAKIL